MESEGNTESDLPKEIETEAPTAVMEIEESVVEKEYREEVRTPKIHEWVIVQVCDDKMKKKKYYMAIINEVSPTLKVRFLKHVIGTTNVFVTSNVPGDDSCEIDASDIVMYAHEPKIDKRGRMISDVNVKCWPK